MTSISINIEDQLKTQIEAKAADMKVPTNELILQAIKDFLYFDKINMLRDQLEEKLKAKGYQNEDDIYNSIS